MDYKLQTSKKIFILLFLLTLSSGMISAQEIATWNKFAKGDYDKQDKNIKSLKSVFTELESKDQVSFAFEDKIIEDKFINTENLSWQNNEQTIENTLKQILHPFQLEFTKVEGYYVIQNNGKNPPKDEFNQLRGKKIKEDKQVARDPGKAKHRDAINKMLGSKINRLNKVYQDQTVSGKVTKAEDGEGLPGVNVVVPGTNRGTVTDVNGDYQINVPSDANTLVYSFTGYENQEVTIGDRSTIDVVMEQSLQALEEVVVIGYGTEQKRDLTGSVSSVTSEDFEQQPLTRLDEALQGRAAGVQVTRNSGAPGGDVKIRIRGSNSIRGDNSPLYVIDGFIGGSFKNLNPNDIESIEILKGASATAIYGSRGANGVVLITTKSGGDRAPQISLQSFYRREEVPRKIDLLNAAEFAEEVNAMNEAIGSDPHFSDSQIQDFRQNGGTDWQDAIFRKGGTQNYQLSLNGGGDITQYFISGNFVDQKGILENVGYDRKSFRANLNNNVSDRLNVKLNLFGSREFHHNSQYLGGFTSPVTQALAWTPTEPIYETSGDFNGFANIASIKVNPLAKLNAQINDETIYDAQFNGSADYQITDNLELSVTGGMELRDGSNKSLTDWSKTSGATSPSSAGVNETQFLSWQNSNILTYTKDFNANNELKLTGIYEQQVRQFEAKSGDANKLVTTSLGYYNLALGESQSVSSNYWKESLQSFVGRANYTLLDRYLFTATLRADGASKFRGENKYGYFPSGAIAWRASEEPFINNLNIFDDLKFRASYGITGSQAIDPYATLSLLRTGGGFNYPVDGSSLNPGVGVGTPSNPNLKWEETSQLNIGTDITFYNGRLGITADLYNKITDDLLLAVPVPQYGGGGNIIQNIGAMENKGFELFLRGHPFVGDNFSWETSFNISSNQNKVLDLGDEEMIFPGDTYGGGVASSNTFVVKEGDPLGQFWGLEYLGVWKSSEASEAAEYGAQPGDSKYADINNDGLINTDDFHIIGNAYPEFSWGFNNNFSFGNFSLNMFFQGISGNQIFNMNRWNTLGLGADARHPTHPDIKNRWTPENEDTDIPAYSSSNKNFMQSSRWLEDGSFFRVKNATLTYNFPQSLVNTLNIGEASLYLSGQNLVTITDYTGYDPESNSVDAETDVDFGFDAGSYPNPRVYTLGLNVTF